MTRVKICGITRIEDALAAIEMGAHALGFVLEPSSPRYVGERGDLLQAIASLPPFVSTVAVYGIRGAGRGDWEEAVSATQAVEGESAKPLLRTLRLQSEADLARIAEAARHAAALVLDAFHPEQMGGTGQPVDWSLAAQVRELSPVPVILAGGLTPENVAEAAYVVRPYAVDVSSGVESEPGLKDHRKIEAFIRAVALI
ncbi:MAG: phosphoribosylanthranilate isomerase [Fimbriimonadia bacterium]|jgi:phosphoribosylanthranilate isomerase